MLTCSYITPPSALILAVDKSSSELFGLDDDELNVMLKDKNKAHKFTESEPKYEEKSATKKNEVTTKFQLQYHDCVDDDVFTLGFFDQVIMSVCMTEYLQGNKIVTPNIIYRDLGGAKNSSCFCYINKILQSIQKLANLEMRLDATEAARFLFTVKSDKFDNIRFGFVLPADEVTAKLNGQVCKAYRLNQLSLVFEYARCKGHLIQIPIAHLQVPHTKNTWEFMLIKLYLYTRILRIQRKLSHSQKKQPDASPQSILLETMYQTCGFTEQVKHWKFRKDLMSHIVKFMDHLIQLKVISSYQLVDGNKNPQRYLKDCRNILFKPIIKSLQSEES